MWLLRATWSGDASGRRCRDVLAQASVDQPFLRPALLPDAGVDAAFDQNGMVEPGQLWMFPARAASAASQVRCQRGSFEGKAGVAGGLCGLGCCAKARPGTRPAPVASADSLRKSLRLSAGLGFCIMAVKCSSCCRCWAADDRLDCACESTPEPNPATILRTAVLFPPIRLWMCFSSVES